MNRVYALFTLIMISVSCSPKIGSTIIAKQDPLVFSDLVLVIDENEYFPNAGIEIGTIKSSDNGFNTNCDFKSILQNLKSTCRQKGANVMKIIEKEKPDQWSSCNRVTARIYRVPDYKVYQKKIEWSNLRRLSFQDFKGDAQDNTDDNRPAQAHCAFSLQNNTEQPLYSDEKLYVKNTFNCRLSWIKQGMSNNAAVLKHVQGLFDLSEVYARLLRKNLAEKNLNVFNNINASAIAFNDIAALYLERRQLYENQTNYGSNADEQAWWLKEIANELKGLQAYYEND